jgi:signal recognition particle receptor subunit beta
MAFFDPAEQRMGVRVVYDGVAGSGKTTNLRQLCALFATQRTTELYTPAELDGRTLYFDWAQISAGVVCGFPLLCQVISVPGHVVLTPRRRHLLATADVVVYVCDSTASSVERAREGLELVDAIGRERGAPLPFLIQANKQDQAGALAGGALLRELGREGVPFVEAIAADGIGVVDTFVHAVRAVSRRMQERSNAGTLQVPVRAADRPADLLAELAEAALDPEMAAEMLLEEASAAFLLAGLEGPSDEAAGESAEPVVDARPERTSRAPARIDRSRSLPRLPQGDVPTGFVWPAHTGRGTLHELHDGGALRDAVPSATGEGAFVRDAGNFVLRTALAARFEDAESARQALVRAARERTQLGSLLAPETVLVAQDDGREATWIWTLTPRMPDLVRWLEERHEDPASTGPALVAFGNALATAVTLARLQGIGMSLEPRAFGVQEGVLRYVGDLGRAPITEAEVDVAVTEAVRVVETARGNGPLVLEAFSAELRRRLSQAEVAGLGSGKAA